MAAGGSGRGRGGLPVLRLNEGDNSPTREEDIGELLAATGDTYDAWLHKFMLALGCVHVAEVLNPLMEQGRWLDVSGYLGRAFRFHITEALHLDPAVPSNHWIWKIRWSHPELYMLPLLQHAMELARVGLMQEAAEFRQDLEQVVKWTREKSSPLHGQFLADMIHPLVNAINNGILALDEQAMEEGRDRTRSAIRDYLHVYLPTASGRMEQLIGVADETGDLAFADKLPNLHRRYRCLVCHTVVCGDMWHVRRHLREYCRASTDCVRKRLKDPPDGGGSSGGGKRKRRQNYGDAAAAKDPAPAAAGMVGAAARRLEPPVAQLRRPRSWLRPRLMPIEDQLNNVLGDACK